MDDLYNPQTNKAKMMSKGESPTDANRRPWIVNMRRKAPKVSESDSQDGTAGVVVACSALEVKYQEVLHGKLAELDLSIIQWSAASSGTLLGGAMGMHTWKGSKTQLACHIRWRTDELNSESNPLSVPENEYEEGKEAYNAIGRQEKGSQWILELSSPGTRRSPRKRASGTRPCMLNAATRWRRARVC